MKNKAFLLFLLCGISENPLTSAFSVISPYRTFPKKSSALFYEGKGDYYGEVDSTPMIREFATMEQLEEVVKLASQPLPERPDGIVTVVKFTSEIREECRATEAEYERVSRKHPDTLFLRCFEEFQDANVLMSQADVTVLPTFDIFYGGNRVGRVEGPKYPDVEDLIKRYGFINSKLDLFSEEADNKRKLRWGDGKAIDYTKTPRTTARFIPGYDWNSNKGFFDAQADKAQEDFEAQYGNWVPDIDDDDRRKK